MSNFDIIHNPLHFRILFYNQVRKGVIDIYYEPIIEVILYFVWAGITISRSILIEKKKNSDLYFLCLATYKSFLPIIQNIRIGNIAAAYVLMRTHMEQIALLGFLHENEELVHRYVKGEDLKRRALEWAKKNTVVNWASFYGNYSKIVHSKLENTAICVMDESEIGIILQESLPYLKVEKDKLTDELLAGIIYSLMALDTFNESIIGRKLINANIVTESGGSITSNHLKILQDFVSRFIDKYRLMNSKIQ